MKKIAFILIIILSACGGKPPETELATDVEDYEYIAKQAIDFAEKLHHQPLALLDYSVADFCARNCLTRTIETASLDMTEMLRSAGLNNLDFEAQHIKYYNDRQIEILLHGSDTNHQKGIALLLNMRLVDGQWKLDLSHYLER